jgi:hypothetical protein
VLLSVLLAGVALGAGGRILDHRSEPEASVTGYPVYVPPRPGECMRSVYADHVADAKGPATPIAPIRAAVPDAGALRERAVTADIRVFERFDNGRLVAAYQVVRAPRGGWLFTYGAESRPCPEPR